MHKYVIMGAPGSGKGTQAAMLARDLDLVQIAVGEMFRWHVQQHTKIGTRVRQTMAAGELVSDDLVMSLVDERLRAHDWNYGFIIDGFPRSPRQAEFLMADYDVDAVIHLDLPADEVRRRVLGRRLCGRCGADYGTVAGGTAGHGTTDAGGIPDGGRCRSCGGEIVTREDDTDEALVRRLREYREKTYPVLELLGRKERVVTVDARPDRATVQREIRQVLGLPEYHGQPG
ncbi:adenylate kinase family protein [Planosporangium sp. 12N6]|uniref:adenylate kinase family protein n=1 Tax=Planosporangium spinosum TaxID=3402278 RepID=UPI003CF260D0